MSKKMVTSLAVLLGLMIAGNVYAMGPRNCGGAGFTAITNVNVESVKNFLEDTSAVRNELIIKKIELWKEYAKNRYDYDQIAKIQKEIIDLKTKVMDSAKKYGLDRTIMHWLTMKHGMMEHGKMGAGMMGRGMGPGTGYGPCVAPE